MGLFINSQLQSLNIHKRLTELEKLSEISTGILALKSMIEDGDNLNNRQVALENLTRILPMLSATQQKYVMDEIFTPLLNDPENTFQSNYIATDENQSVDHELEGTSSDYEMEFQLKLNKAKFDVKELNRSQLKFRREQEKERLRDEQEKRIEERRLLAIKKVNSQIENFWTKINKTNESKSWYLKRDLKSFIYLFDSSVSRDHPLLTEAKQRLKTLP